jgi:hypothetical protein
MDKLEISADGTKHLFMLTIESHQGRVSAAMQTSWLTQKQIDPADTSQDFAASMINTASAPTSSGRGSSYGSSGYDIRAE